MEITLKCKKYVKLWGKNQCHNISVAIFSNWLKNHVPYKNTFKPVHHYKFHSPIFHLSAEANEPRHLALGVLVVTVLIIK